MYREEESALSDFLLDDALIFLQRLAITDNSNDDKICEIMYSGFNLTFDWEDERFYRYGISAMSVMKTAVQDKLKGFILPNGFIDGTKLSDSWFPTLEVDIFISHSHTDQKKAITLAGWLNQKFGPSVFVDSCIWGYAATLLKIIDNEYCYQPQSNTYNYEHRNASTSHIHMMLATALDKMIDTTECLIFLNTPNSISSKEIVDKTASPWIYHELATSKIIRKWKPDELIRKRTKNFSKAIREAESPNFLYAVPTEHLTKLSESDLLLWDQEQEINEFPLDSLYQLKFSKRL